MQSAATGLKSALHAAGSSRRLVELVGRAQERVILGEGQVEQGVVRLDVGRLELDPLSRKLRGQGGYFLQRPFVVLNKGNAAALVSRHGPSYDPPIGQRAPVTVKWALQLNRN